MKAVILVYRGTDTVPIVTGTLEGDAMEIIDIHRELNARWPGRRAEVYVDKSAEHLQPTG